jgi:hypothetical protein
MAEGSGGGGTSPLVVGIVAVLAAAITGAASYGAAYLTFAGKDQELKVHLVEIAISILRADPKEDVTPARGWALDIIEKNSGVPFSPEDRDALLHKPLAGKDAYWKTDGADDLADSLVKALKQEGIPVIKMTPDKQTPAEGK